VNSITCWKVERFVQAIVKGKTLFGRGGNSIRTRAARQLLGTEPWLFSSCSAAVWIAAHSEARQRFRFPLPQ
jgi:hypothetical protein